MSSCSNKNACACTVLLVSQLHMQAPNGIIFKVQSISHMYTYDIDHKIANHTYIHHDLKKIILTRFALKGPYEKNITLKFKYFNLFLLIYSHALPTFFIVLHIINM